LAPSQWGENSCKPKPTTTKNLKKKKKKKTFLVAYVYLILLCPQPICLFQLSHLEKELELGHILRRPECDFWLKIPWRRKKPSILALKDFIDIGAY